MKVLETAPPPPKLRIGISSCLLGQEVRYSGGHKRDDFLVGTFGPFVEWVPVCPEVEIGMGVPRPAIRLERLGGDVRLEGTAADLLKIAMIAIDCRVRAEFPASHILLTAPDEQVLEVPEKYAEAVAALVKKEMEGVASLAVPLEVEVGWGKSWYEAKG